MQLSVFPRHGGQVLLQRRGDGSLHPIQETSSHPLKETLPRLIAERLGTELEVTAIRTGTAPQAGDARPVLLDIDDRPDTIGDPGLEWVHATDLLTGPSELPTWEAYRTVGPTPEEVLDDLAHGSTTVSLHALEALRDRAGELTTSRESREEPWRELTGIARRLATARPEMTALQTRIDRAVSSASDPRELESRCRAEIERARRCDKQAASHVVARCKNSRILTISRSGTVLQALQSAEAGPVELLRSRPGDEAIEMAGALVTHMPVRLSPDAALGHRLATGSIDLVLVGADTITPDGTVINKVGTRTTALAAAVHEIPFVVITATDKIAPEAPPTLETIESADGVDPRLGIDTSCPRFDRTEFDLITEVVTENGSLSRDDIQDIADSHATNRAWRM